MPPSADPEHLLGLHGRASIRLPRHESPQELRLRVRGACVRQQELVDRMNGLARRALAAVEVSRRFAQFAEFAEPRS